MAFEAYSVAVKLSLINHVSAGMAMISKSLASTGGDVDKLNAKLASIGKQGAIGAAMFAGGLGLASMLKGPLDEAKKFQNETERFRSLGLGDKVTADAVKFASGMNTYGTSIRENLGLLRDAQTVFGDFHEAQMVTPLLAKMKFANAALYGDEGGAMKDRAFMDMLKVIEMRGGLSSQEAFTNQANMVQRVQTATGGRVGANEYLNFIKTGGVAAKGMKDENFYYAMEPLIQEMGGNRVGTGLMSAYQNLVQGRTTQRAANELMRIGMLNPKMVDYDKVGNIKQIKPGAVSGSDIMISDPMKWMQTVMLPAFASKGITDKQAILNEIGAIFTNRTASQLYSTMYLQQANIAKNFKLNSGAAGIDELDANAKKTLTGKLIELDKKWLDLQLKLGDVILPLAIRAVDGLNNAIKNLTVWIDANPSKVKALTYAFMGLSAFLITGGLINMIIAAGRGFWLLAKALIFVGTGGLAPLIPWIARMATYLVMGATGFAKFLLVAGRFLLLNPIGLVITAIAAAAFLLWNNWSEISGALKLMWSDMKTGFIQLFHGDIGGAFKSFALVFLTGWQTIFNTLIAGANTILPASMQISKTTFADEYRKTVPGAAQLVAPVPAKDYSKDPIIVQMNMDGKRVAEVVVDRMTKSATKPRTGTQGFDPTRSMLMPGTPSTALPRG
ncbi:hypothetical protein [Pseudomonas extremaustralis]|uniref:Phage tail tape measure protein n=1 Tax=Pseudomonas extremaustralis TaxID=359110 RepID=A0A5C5Q7D6_9PSED|nr:hypothetical protein [Pseudomonas extremaustralis]EZI23780.1 hypothetical protein PE143B_0129800 [Pseudomonas extremaustralis 14-3 substr. 14-3b]TWS01499.1 hypothetical protein FIV36_24890 [Pseudomonas extremaustralis]SDG46400.1 hypothetical protein SAMN05216591_6162 [Pseudomonas extremaustralis]